jgi:hypothetical protein
MKGMTKEKDRRRFGGFIEAMARTSGRTTVQVPVAETRLLVPDRRQYRTV